ncbi:MAG: hypothetical protein HYY58_04355 [Candidatus Omnitrophica bacterium]|nr:hypothetical protein [Candidatus Omnitrophota bacterium]
MNSVIERLMDVVEHDPAPAVYTSSYWQEYTARNTVRLEEGQLVLRGFGIGDVGRPGLPGRLLHQLERLSYRRLTTSLPQYPAVWRRTTRLARQMRFGLTFDVWKSAVILTLLADHWKDARLSPRTCAMIGDGYGFLGALIRHYVPGIRMYCIDLPKTLVFQADTHQRADPRVRISFLAQQGGTEEGPPAELALVLPQAIERVSDPIDCAINVASMQEMNAATIQTYFAFLRRRSGPESRFYCVNRVEKILPGGEVARFADYPWHDRDEVFLDGVCPYYTHYLSRYRGAHGPTVCGIRVPWVSCFDGEHRHRLVRLAPLQAR